MTDVQLLVQPSRPPGPPGGAGMLEIPVVFDAGRPLLLSGPVPDGLAAHRARFGMLPDIDDQIEHAGLLDRVERLGLAGRGGGHFAVAAKWRAALAGDGGGMVVANGAEGEPASAKDAALLLHRPHLVLDGLACAAAAVGATRTVVWLHEGAASTRRAVTMAVQERRAARMPEPTVRIVTGPDAYLSGESSAVVHALSGGPAVPQFRRARAAADGVDGLPTLVHNVETLARIGLVARERHAGGYRDTTLVTVLSGGRRTVLEVDPASTVATALGLAGWTAGRPQAVLLGGYGGSWVPWATAAALPLEHRALRAAGAGLGAGVIAALSARTCGISETAAVVDFLARAGARQCGPCLFGLRAIADLLLELARGNGGRGHLRRLRRYAGEVAGRGACHHPDGVVRLVWTALATFEEDLTEHARRGRCLHSGTAAVLPIPGREPNPDGGGR